MGQKLSAKTTQIQTKPRLIQESLLLMFQKNQLYVLALVVVLLFFLSTAIPSSATLRGTPKTDDAESVSRTVKNTIYYCLTYFDDVLHHPFKVLLVLLYWLFAPLAVVCHFLCYYFEQIPEYLHHHTFHHYLPQRNVSSYFPEL